MNFLEYVNKNTEGLVFIEKLRNTIQSISRKGIKEEFEGASDSDLDKLSLMVEFNFFDGITAWDSQWDINTMSIEDVEFMISSTIGFHNLCGGLDKNRRESYSEILFDVTCHGISTIENIDEACEYSNNIKKFYLINFEDYDGEYSGNIDDEMQKVLTDIYSYLLKDKIKN